MPAGWLATDPEPQRPPARAAKGWAPRPQGKVKLMTGWNVPETGAGQTEDQGVGIRPPAPLAPAMPAVSPWRANLPSTLPSPPAPTPAAPSLTTPPTPVIPQAGPSTSPSVAAPSPGPVGVLRPSAATPTQTPARVPPQGGQGAVSVPSQQPGPAPQPILSQSSGQPPPSQNDPSLPTPTPKAPGDYIDKTRQAAVAAGIDPDIFARQIQQESGFNPNAKSPAGAIGIAQFMPDTAKGLGINPSDPDAALTGAAKLMRSYVDQYHGDYRMALAAYNAGPGAVDQYGGVPPFKETQSYVQRIYGNGPGPSDSASPQAVHKGGQSQFDLGLSTADAYAFCGPAAAMAFASTYGRNPTADEAKALAQKVGWNASTGMAGVGSEQKLLTDMGVATRLEDKINWDHVATDASNGNPVIVDTPGHYYFVDGYNATNGKFHVGFSGTELKGGSEWLSASEINAMPQSGGSARAALYADHPLSDTPSVFTPGRTAPNDQATALGTLPAGLPPEWQALWQKPVMGGGQDNPVQQATGWLSNAASGVGAWGQQQLQAASNQAKDQIDPLKRQYPIVGPTGLLGIYDPRLGGKGDEGGAPDTGDVGKIDLGGVAKGASDVEDPSAYPGGSPGYALPQGPPSPPKSPGPAPFDLQALDKGPQAGMSSMYAYKYDPADQAVHQFTDPTGTDLVVVKDTTSQAPDTQYLYVDSNTGEIVHKDFANHDPAPDELEAEYQQWLTGGSPLAVLHQNAPGAAYPQQGQKTVLPGGAVTYQQPQGPVQGPQPMQTQQLPLSGMPAMPSAQSTKANPITGPVSANPPVAGWNAPLPPYSGWTPPQGMDDTQVAGIIQQFVGGGMDQTHLDATLGSADLYDIQAYALHKAAAGDRTLIDKMPALVSHQFSHGYLDIDDPQIVNLRTRMKAGTDGLKVTSPYNIGSDFKPTGVPLGDPTGAGEIQTAGVYFDTHPFTATNRYGNMDAYAQVWDLQNIPKDRILNLRDDPDGVGIMQQVTNEARSEWDQDQTRNFGMVLYDRLRARGYVAVYNGGYGNEVGETTLLDDPANWGTLVADGKASDMIQKLQDGPQWGPGLASGLVLGGYFKSQQGQQPQPAQNGGAGQEDIPWWQQAGNVVTGIAGDVASGLGTAAQGAVQGATALPGAVASAAGPALGTMAAGAHDVVQGVADLPDPASPQATVSSLPTHAPPGAQTLAQTVATADQPRPDVLTPLDTSGLDVTQNNKLPTLPNLAKTNQAPARRPVQQPPPDQAPAATGQPVLPQPAPDQPMTAIEKVTRGQTGQAIGVKQHDLGSMVDSIARDPVADVSDNGYRAQLRKAAEKAIINVDGGPLQMLFDPTIAAFGTQAPVQTAINALFGQDPLTGMVTQEVVGAGGKLLGRVIAPVAPAKFVAQAAQKTLNAIQWPAAKVAQGTAAGINGLITRGLDPAMLTAARGTLADTFDATTQADVLEAAGAYLRDPSLDAEALRLRRMTNLIKPLTGSELASQVQSLAQKAGKPELADAILRNAGFGEVAGPYTQALRRLDSLPARGIPEIARSSTNLVLGSTAGAAVAGMTAHDQSDPGYNSKLLAGAGIGAGMLIGQPYVANWMSKTVAPNLLATARELVGNLGNLRGPTQAILKDFVGQKQVIDYLRKQMADDIRSAFGAEANWPSVFKYLEENGTLPPELQASRKAQAVWQEILDSNARALTRGDINDVTTMLPKTPGFQGPQAYLHHAVDSDWQAALRGAERFDPTPPKSGFRGNPIAQYTKPRDWATVAEGEAQPSPVKYNYDLDQILSHQWANQQMQDLNEVLEGNLRGSAMDHVPVGKDATDFDILTDNAQAHLPKGYQKGSELLQDLNISPQLRSSISRLYSDRGWTSVPGIGKGYTAVTKFFGGLKVGMLAASGFHLLNEWNQFGASQGLIEAESQLPELTQMAFSRGAWRNFLDIHKGTITHAIGDGLSFDPFSAPEKASWSRLAQAGILGGGGYATGFTTAKQRGKTDEEAAAWGSIGAGLGAGMAVPFFGKNGALVDVVTDSLFHRTIPMMKLQAYLAHGATPEAAMFANEAFGGINSDAILRSRWFSDTARLAGFAPDWTEGFWRQAGRALWDTGGTGQMQRQFWANAAMNGMYMLSGFNLMLSGHWPWQNEPGHELTPETTGLYDKNGWSRVPQGSLTGEPQRTYMDIIPAWRSMIEPPWQTARWLLAAAASTPDGQRLGLDNPHITGISNGVQAYPKPDPATAWSTYLGNRQGLIPATVTSLFAQTDYTGRPLSQPGDTALDSIMRAASSSLQKLTPLGPAQGITEAIKGEPLPMAIFGGVTGIRESTTSPSKTAADVRTRIRQDTTGENLAQQRLLDDKRIQYNQVQDQKALGIMDDPSLTPAQKLQQARQFPHQNVDTALEAQIPPEIRMQHPDTAAGMIAQINAVNKAAASSASTDPADLPASGEVNADDLFQSAWNRDPSQLAGKTPDQQWVIRQQWTVQTAQQNGLDQKVVEDQVKARLYGLDVPPVPGVSSLELDQLADDWKGAGDSDQPASQHAQRQELLNDFAQQKGVDPNALSQRVRLRILLANDQSPSQQSYSRALTVLEAAHNPATAPEYTNEDGTPMGTADDWVKWDARLKANTDKYDKPHGRYLDPQLQILSAAKTRGAVLPAATAYASKDYWEYEKWFGVGRNMTDDNWNKYRAGTLEMWTDKPDPKEAQNRTNILGLYAALTPDQRTKAQVSFAWHGKVYKTTIKYAIHTLGLVKSNKWQELGLDPGIDPGAPGVDTGFQ